MLRALQFLAAIEPRMAMIAQAMFCRRVVVMSFHGAAKPGKDVFVAAHAANATAMDMSLAPVGFARIGETIADNEMLDEIERMSAQAERPEVTNG